MGTYLLLQKGTWAYLAVFQSIYTKQVAMTVGVNSSLLFGENVHLSRRSKELVCT
jgi:hypothetical protein